MKVSKLPSILATSVALAFASMSAAWGADLEMLQPGKLQVATEGTYPPFSMQSPDGKLDGLEIRVAKEVARRLNVEYVPVVIKWESILIGLMSDQYDMISAAMDITPERQKQVTFANGWLESGGRVVTKVNSPIKSGADIKGKTVGALVASTWTKLAEERGAKEVKTYKAESDALQDLVNGNIDAVITDSIAAAYAIKTSKLPLTMTEDYVSQVQKGFPFKKGKPNLVKAVNKAIEDMIADGTYARLTTELVGYSPAPKQPIQTQF